jgi:O-antigen/teichoic acid export membrane protein
MRAVAASVFPTGRSARNVGWNLLGGVAAGVAVVLATPVYVARLGLEGYGIVGLWLVMQVMLSILDIGMGATVVKAFAGSTPDEAGRAFRRDLLRTLERFYWGVAGALGLMLVLGADLIARHWLKSTTLESVQIAHALQLMAVALAAQFPMSLYANGLAGLQEHRRMNLLQIMGNVLRYGGGVLTLLWRPDVVSFFITQAVVATVQTLITRYALRRLVISPGAPPAVARMALVRAMWGYSAGMGVSALGSVMIANADRLALTALRPAAELGKYSIAFTATGLLQLAIQPFYRSFFPRYAELVALGQPERLRDEYFRSCQLIAGLLVPLGILGGTFAPELLRAWLGRSDATVTLVFRCLLFAITCTGLMWLPAAFQQAHGWTRLHATMIGSALVVGAPLMVWAIRSMGTVGATTVWVIHGVSGITIELWLMHRRLLVGELWNWCRAVLVPPLVLALPMAALSAWAMPADLGRWGDFGWVAMTTAIVVASVFGAQLVRVRRKLTSNPVEAV